MSESASIEQRHPATGVPSVQIDHVYKDYGSTRAVDGISLAVEQGEFLTLLGPSGCGKTTTLRMIGGFEYPTAGQIAINGEPMGNRPPYRRPVNTVFQNYALFPHMTEGRKPSQLSGGQQQRIALARALVNRPQVLLLDEPLGALDLKLRKAMQLELKSLNREVGITFIYVTHDQDEALTMSDRIAVMSAGKILQLGAPREIYEHPRNRFVADFIGETNMLRGTLDSIDGHLATIGLAEVGQIRAVAGEIAISANPGTEMEISVRPERMTMHRPENLQGDHSRENRLDGTIDDAIYLGTHTQFVVRFADGQTATVHLQNSAAHGSGFSVGEAASLLFSPESAAVLES
jgi:spermidine/putrescine transport system ATP-binding protein